MNAELDGGALPASIWRPEAVSEILTRAADGGHNGIVFAGSAISYRDLHAAAARAARHLQRGALVPIPPGDPEAFLPALWACFMAGAVPVVGPQKQQAAPLPALGPDVALVLCTSGSTGQPKAVPLTHANIVASVAASTFVNGYGPEDVSLNWLPLWHVGGLMRSIREVYIGCRQVQIPVATVRDDPLQWLDLIDRYRATLAWGSNAAYAAVVARRRELPARGGWALDSLRSMYSSGEPVVTTTMDAFIDMLLPYGFRPESLRVAWGMTEACFATSSSCLDDVGAPVPGVSLRIVDDGGGVCEEGAIGRLRVAGPLVASDGWLDTGDLGSVTGGRLKIVGRASDAIRIGAITYANRDIEAIVEAIDGVGSVAACGVGGAGGEALAIFADIDEALLPEARARVAAASGVAPRFVIPLSRESFPRTDVGKISRTALRASFAAGAFDRFRRWPYDLQAGGMIDEGSVTDPERRRAQEIAAILTDVLHVPVGVEDDFFNLGGTSLRVAQAAARIGCALVDVFSAPTPLALARRLLQRVPDAAAVPAHPPGDAIAIVGAACRFPGAPDLDAFWQLLVEGKDALTKFSDADLSASGIDSKVSANPAYVRAGMILDDIEHFDADFFGLSARDAAVMDPQQRLLLECAWHALEDAGRVPDAVSNRVGVWVGARLSDYLLSRMPPPDLFGHQESPAEGLRRLVLNDKDYFATRLAHSLDCRGPAVTVQTACSSSLVAVHLACQALRGGECDVALAGGVSLRVPHRAGHLYTDGMVLSADGRTRPFDAAATGTTFGSGVGVVALRRLTDALRDGDRIYAVIRGSAVNNDGAGPKPAFTAPSHEGQARVVRAALATAGVEASTVSYVEAHGTGTAVGDPIEIAALGDAFVGAPAGHCAVGSVKSNIGHLVQAAGVAGLIKTALMLRHRMFVPTANFETPNPLIDFATSPFYVNTATRSWASNGSPLRAGVSAFGFGGTNAHVVLEEAPSDARKPATTSSDLPRILPLSARSPDALRALATAYERLDAPPGDLCASAQQTRAHLSHRLAVVARSSDELRRKLAAAAAGDFARPARRPRVAFVFSGQGTQHAGMGRALYEAYEPFRRAVDDHALGEILFTSGLERTDLVQPALVALEAALAMVWRSWGIEPDVVLGHSVGEIAAAWAAGTFSLEDALRFAAARGRLMQGTEPGLTATVCAPPHAVAACRPDVAIAAVNAPAQTVIAGPAALVESALADFAARGISAQTLPGAVAFHSALMEPILDDIAAEAGRLSRSVPRCTVVSTLTGGEADGEFASPAYWRRQARETVRFVDALNAAEVDVVVPIGPGHDRLEEMLSTLATLYVRGIDVNWDAVASGPWRRVTLPKYPFQRKRYWIASQSQRPPALPAAHPLLGRRMASPLAEVQFQSELTADLAPFARDHWIFGMRPLVMVGQLEMMRAALDAPAVTIEDAVVEQPLLLSDAPKVVQTILGAAGDVRIFSSTNGEAWDLHARARVKGTAPETRHLDLAAIRGRCGQALSAADVYGHRTAKGAAIGPGVKLVRQAWRGRGEVLAEAALDVEGREWAPSYAAYPGLLDSLAQCAELACADGDPRRKTDLFLPTVAERVVFFGALPDRVWTTVRARADLGGDVYGVDGEIADQTGYVLVAVEGLCFKRATPAALTRAETFYEPDWIPLDDDDGPVEEGWRVVAPGGESALDVYAETLDVVRAMLDDNSAGPLWLITRGAQATGRETGPLAPDQAALWGFGRALQREQPQLRCRLIDLDPAEEDDGGLARAMSRAATEGEVVVRGGVLYGRRLRRALPLAAAASPYALRAGRDRTLQGLAISKAQRRDPGAGEIEIEVYCTGVNFRDVLNAAGRIDGPLGYECSGVVARCGPGVTGFEPGMPVMALALDSCASHVTVDARFAVHKPRTLTFAAAATSLVAYLTAMHGLLDLARLQPGERVLIHTAAGGVGQAAIHVARAAGAEVVATASRRKQALVRTLGVREVEDSRAPGFSRHLARIDVVLNTLGDEFTDDNLSVLRSGGRLVELGHPRLLDLSRTAERARAAGVTFDNFHLAQDVSPDRIQQMLFVLAEALGSRRLSPLPCRTFALADAGQAFEMVTRGAHVGKLALVHPAAERGAFTADPGVTYVITGGSGAIGRRIAQWLVERGARHLAVISRRSIVADALNTQADLRTFHADVADAEALAGALAHIAEAMPPVRGIVHAAGVIDDGVVVDETRERAAAVLAPKVDGAWNLHRLTEQMPLEFFVLVSSVAGLWGSAGQSSYAAANAVLDQLAHYRRQRGLPATVVDYGAWGGAGMAATLTSEARRRRMTMGAAEIRPDAAIQGLELAMVRDRPQVAIFAGASPLDRGSTAPAVPDAQANGATPRGVEDAIERITTQVAMLTGTTTLDPRRPLPELGLDSLSVLVLRGRLVAEFGAAGALPVVRFLEGRTIAELAALVCERAGVSPPAEPASLMPLKPSGTRPPVLFVPPALRTAFRFSALADALEGHPVYGLTPVGLDGRHPPHDSVEQMAAHYLQEIGAAGLTGPYIVGGACFGGLVAWEMARQLTAAGADVPLVVLIDSAAPEEAGVRPRGAVYLDLVTGPVHWLRGKQLGLLQHLRYHTLRRWVRARLSGEQFRLEGHLQEVLRAHGCAGAGYRARPFDGNVLLVQSAEYRYYGKRWRRLARGSLETVLLPGTRHADLVAPAYAGRIARLIADRLRAL